jgi:hypothetical protein
MKINLIKRGNTRMDSTLILVDDGFSECVKKWCTSQRNKFLQIIDGVNKGSIITSMYGAMTSIHVEDTLLSTFYLMIVGTSKIWYLRHFSCFREFLRENEFLEMKGLRGIELLYSLCVPIVCFCKKRVALLQFQ